MINVAVSLLAASRVAEFAADIPDVSSATAGSASKRHSSGGRNLIFGTVDLGLALGAMRPFIR
jgi:hypothetical protein